LQTNFSVDEFLHNYRYSATLETFRDDLGIYLKILRSSMIELINEDYVDMVNLSSNFVNLDKSISNIKNPLVELRNEVLIVRTSLQECMDEINECLNEKRRFKRIKKSLQTLEIVRNKLETLTRFLSKVDSSDNNDRAMLLERAGLEIIQLQFNAKYCQHFLDTNEKASIEEQEKKLLSFLNDFFLWTLEEKTKTPENLERCLRIYFTLDKCELAEKIFRKETFNYMESIINERNLQNNPNNLAGIYNQILDFVSLKMKNLLSLTRGKSMKIEGYNFLFNSFWSAIEERLETNLKSIFASGDPQNFYQKYKWTLEFLARIEMIIDDPQLIEQFHEHEQYKKFQMRWNLPVYFLIRSQEIACSLEKVCKVNWDTILTAPSSNDSNQMQIKLFVEMINCIAKCWTDGIYLDQLYKEFFKLTFQLIARGVRWTQDVLKATAGSFEHPGLDIQSFYTVLHHDIGILVLKFPQVEQLATQKMSEHSTLKGKIDQNSIKSCFAGPHASLEECQRTIESQIVKKLMILCLKSIKNVQDIPRLFRKTNREVPTKHLPYVEQIVQPIDDFVEKYSKNYHTDVVRRILKDLFSQMTIQYYQSVSEVLTSVQKTEESLRRLKNLREKPQNANASGEKQLMSDDDKIRLQLQIDIMQYVKYVEGHQLKRDEIDSLITLINLIGDITKIKFVAN
jgi:conserved oligomeric Golgi complex subunit 2